jgi:hypothetical protein
MIIVTTNFGQNKVHIPYFVMAATASQVQQPVTYRLWKLRYLIDAANTSQKTQIKPSNTATHTPTIECLKSKYDSKYPWTVVPAGYPAAVNGVVISPNWDTTKPYKVHATGLR